jgi:hypothetical protein
MLDSYPASYKPKGSIRRPIVKKVDEEETDDEDGGPRVRCFVRTALARRTAVSQWYIGKRPWRALLRAGEKQAAHCPMQRSQAAFCPMPRSHCCQPP